MKKHYHKLLTLLLFSLFTQTVTHAQLTVPDYTACPNQTITVTATWNNVSSISYSLYGPPAGTGGNPIIPAFSSSTFQISSPANAVFVLVGSGTFQGGPVTQTVNFNLTTIPPPAMTLANVVDYCNGANITIVAPVGGSIYGYQANTGSLPQATLNSNVISIPNAQTNWSGVITVTSVISGCTVTGQTNLNIAPLKVLTINSTSNVCQGANVALTANLPGGTTYQWFDNTQNFIANTQNHNLSGVTVNNSGIYKVTVDDNFNGLLCPYSATTQVNVVQTNPVLPTASPARTVCQGTNLNLSATAGGANSWQWSGPGFSSSLPNPVLSSAVPLMSGIYTVTAIFQGAFISCSTTSTINVAIVPVSTPLITMPNSVCQGSTFTLSGTAASNSVSFSWSGPLFTGSVCTNCTDLSVVDVPTSASGTQFLTVNYAIGSVLCPATSSAQLNVVPVNTVSVIPPGTVCTPQDALLQSLANGASQYNWEGPNGYTNSGANVWVINPTTAASGIYTVTAYFGSGTSLVCSNTNTVKLTVSPVLNFSLNPRQQICYNSPFTLAGPTGATSYTWTSSTGFTSNSRVISIPSAQPNNSGTYTLQVSLGPCITTGESELIVLDRLTFSLTPLDRTVCRGDTLFLEGGATGGSENYAFTWNPPVYLSSSNGPQQVAVPLGSVDYNLIVHDIACPNFTIGHSFKVQVNQPPMPDLRLDRLAGCAPLTLNYDTQVWDESFTTTFEFSATEIIQRDSAFTYSLKEPGTYNVKVYTKGRNGCSGIYELPYPLEVYPNPGVDVYWSPETPTTNDLITFYPTFKSEPITYMSWSFLGGVTPGDTTMNNATGMSDTTNVENPNRIYNQLGTYPVMLICKNEGECVDTVVKFVKVIDELQIFVPNSFTPNGDGINDVFMAKGSGMKLENFTMDIFSRAGQIVFTTKDINEGWNGKVGGQLAKDATYIYLIRVVGMNGEGRREYTGYVNLLK